MRPTPQERLVLVMRASFKASWSALNTRPLEQDFLSPKLPQVLEISFIQAVTFCPSMFLRLLISVKFTNHAKNLDETIKEGAEINTFLQIDDEEDNIQPSFYSFGTGERDVQVRYMFICRREMTQR